VKSFACLVAAGHSQEKSMQTQRREKARRPGIAMRGERFQDPGKSVKGLEIRRITAAYKLGRNHSCAG